MNKGKMFYVSMILTSSIVAGCGQARSNQQEIVASQGNAVTQESAMNSSEVDKSLEGEIKMSIYWAYDGWKEAVEAFNKKYPNAHVELETYIGDLGEINEGRTNEQYINELNTAFMSGEAPDMILIDCETPMYKYVQSGYLMDLSSLIQGEDGFNNENYYMNVIDAMKYEGKNYCVPIQFSVNETGVNQGLLNKSGIDSNKLTNETWTLDSQLELLKEVRKTVDDCYLSVGTARSIFQEYGVKELNQYIDVENKKVSLDSEGFIDLLKKCNQVVEDGYVFSDEQQADYKNVLFAGLAVNEPPLYDSSFYKLRDVEIMDYNYNIAIKPAATSDGEIKLWAPEALAISKESKNQALCWEFIKFMTSTEWQSQESAECPINRNAIKSHGKYLMGSAKKWGYEYVVSEEEVIEDYAKRVDANVAKISGISWLEEGISSTILEEAEKYFNGEKSAEDVAKVLQNKIEVMLNE